MIRDMTNIGITMMSKKNKSFELQIIDELKPFDGFRAAEMYVEHFRAGIREGGNGC